MTTQYALTNNKLLVPGKTKIELETGEIHVWYAWLDEPATDYLKILSPDETDWAERYHFPKDKNSFIVRRGILRQLLGCYLGIEPGEIRFSYSENGKPSLANKYDGPVIFFNQSHSEGLALFAFTRLGEIGIDVEYRHEIGDITGIAHSYFSPGECTALCVLPAGQKQLGFFNCWTRKEAFIKAQGDGLNYPLDKFQVSLGPEKPARLISVKNNPAVATDWSMNNLDLPSGFAGAFVVKGKIGNIIHREWSP